MNNLGQCRTAAPALVKVFAEFESSTTITTMTFTGVNPTVFQPFTELTPDLFNLVNLSAPAFPAASTFEIFRSGTYQFSVDLSVMNAGAGGSRVYELVAFINGVQAGIPQSFTISSADTNAINFTGLTTFTVGDIVDIRMRKTGGPDIIIDFGRVNAYVFSFFHE